LLEPSKVTLVISGRKLKYKPLSRRFYANNPSFVSRNLLGKILVRKLNTLLLMGIIVETEAYYGKEDPASRAHHGLHSFCKPMWGKPGTLFIYNVHKYWMLNVVAHKPDKAGAVLVRSLEPVCGITIMKRNRKVKDVFQLTSGPGRLTEALGIDKSFNETDVTLEKAVICTIDNKATVEIDSSYRVGVKKDLKTKLRFFVKGNKYVSK